MAKDGARLVLYDILFDEPDADPAVDAELSRALRANGRTVVVADYVKQMQGKTPMVFVLRDGETLHGIIEWYDKCCLKVNRTDGPNILLYKPAIKYMYKDGERNS